MNDILENDSTGATNQQQHDSATPVLDNFSTNLNKCAEYGTIDNLVGRETEIRRICDILLRRKKNNPILIGPPGVGKTQIVEGLASKIVEGKCPKNLTDKVIVSLDLSSVVAGTKYRGQFEERIKVIIEELKSNKQILVFIDEIQTLIGSGNSSGAMDGANILKPALSRGDIQIIGATTYEEYRKIIEKDGALDRRFQKIFVDPPSAIETIEILTKAKSNYESHHKVSFTNDVIRHIVELSDKYIHGREFPDKAFDILDEVGAKLQNDYKYPKEIEDLSQRVKETQLSKFEMVKSQNYESAAQLRDLEKRLLKELKDRKQIYNDELTRNMKVATIEDVVEVVSKMSKIPISINSDQDLSLLSSLEDKLNSVVVGQPQAVSKIVRSIKRNRLGITSENRPIGSFLFLGSSGVGKTHLAKSLSSIWFGSDRNIIRVDMSEYQDKSSITKLIGSNPGYVGYDDGGNFTEKVRINPYSVVLFDEVEKSHPDVLNIFLQILDDAYVTDGQNRKISFKNTIIIFTSNIGVKKSIEFGSGIGFSGTKPSDVEHKQSIIEKEVNKFFQPEFLNRLDSVVNFNQLTALDANKIAKIEITKSIDHINSLGYSINVDDSVIDFITSKGYSESSGMRLIKTVIREKIQDLIADTIITKELVKDDTYALKVDSEDLIIVKL